jgi:hypothetical protein
MLAQARANEVAAAENALFNQIAAQLPQHPEIDEQTKLLLVPFLQFTGTAGVRHLPAAPTTCAAFILNQAKAGVGPERIAAEAQAIEKLHDQYNQANPLQTRSARWALDQVLKIEAHRSWPAAEKAMYAHLPVQIRAVISNREKDRERALRRGQNQFAAAIKELDAQRQKQEPDPNPEQPKEDTMPTKEGPYSKSEDLKLKQVPHPDWKTTDISRKVDGNHKINDGFSAPLKGQE